MKQLILVLALILFPMMAYGNETFTTQQYHAPHATGFVYTPRAHEFMMKAEKQSFNDADEVVPGKYSIAGKAGPVEDQGACGSCWDFSLTTTLRGTHIMAGKDPGRLSFNYLLNCADTMNGCDGGDFSAADYFLSPKGAPKYGSDGKYVQVQGSCKHEPVQASAVSYKLLGTNLGNIPDGVTPSFRDIAYVVGVLHQPVSVDVAVTNKWEAYKSGVYNGCDSEDGGINHMIRIEGYDCEKSVDAKGNCVFDANGNLPNGVGVYTVTNQWGTSWGEAGRMRTKATDAQGKKCNGIATDALYFQLK